MIRGLYTSASGLATGQKRLEVVSNNIANVSTNGYRRDKVAVAPFLEHLVGHSDRGNGHPEQTVIGRMTYGSTVDEILPDLRPGLLEQTNNPTDLAITGNGFFSVQTPDGDTLYTRDGAFRVDQEGYLVTAAGDRVLGSNELLQPGKDFRVDTDGGIYSSDGMLVDTILVVQFDDNTELTKVQNNCFALPPGSQPDILPNPVLAQGYLEKSNVNLVDEMVDLIEVSRTYQINQRLLRAQDEILEKAVTQIGVVK
jgi:flagellar basal-body rod protein FlgG